MSFTGIDGLDRSIHTTNRWLADIAAAFGTEDRRIAYRVLRAWLHTLRDRLTVEAAAHLAAQLPDLIRGVFYEGWSPSHVPQKYDAHEFTIRFSDHARIARDDVPKSAAIVTEVVLSHVAAEGVEQALGQLPAGVRAVFQPGGETSE
jgi:uncharacterized protein (DUF2267 family)